MNTAAIIFHYNRPSKIKLILEQLKNTTPLHRYYFFSDGPRSEEDNQKIIKCRKLVNDYFPHSYQKNYKTNQTYKYHFIDDIKEVFEFEESAIIIEDDCFFENDFINSSLYVLNKYKNDKSIFCYKGYNNLIDINDNCYIKTNLFLPPWGWSTWKRSIDLLIDFRIKNISNLIRFKKLKDNTHNLIIRKYLNECEESIRDFSWDNHINLTIRLYNLYVLMPGKNLIKNIGYDDEATATKPLPSIIKYTSEIKNNFNYKTDLLKDMSFLNDSNITEIITLHEKALGL
jgi:hypothetical protein